MSTDRPDLPTFDGRDVREHARAVAESVRAINHITGWPRGLTYPQDASTVVSQLAAVAAMLPQALRQLDKWIVDWQAAGRIGVDSGAEFGDNPSAAVTSASAALQEASNSAGELYIALKEANNILATAYWTGPDPYVEIVDDRGDTRGVDD